VRTHLLAAIGMIGACTFGAHTANASVTSVVVDRNITFKGPGVHHYRYVEAIDPLSNDGTRCEAALRAARSVLERRPSILLVQACSRPSADSWRFAGCGLTIARKNSISYSHSRG
jgi:hypothetical protein